LLLVHPTRDLSKVVRVLKAIILTVLI